MKQISHKIALLGIAALVGLVAVGVFSIYSLTDSTAKIRQAESKARVDGDIYNRLIQDKDVLADVLPPPAYVIESYLVALQLSDATNKAESDKLRGQLTQLQKDFNDSFAHWQKELPAGRLKDSFLKTSEPAVAFYSIVNNQFLPSLDKGDYTGAKQLAKTSLAAEYGKQRAAIDEVVSSASTDSEAMDKNLQELLRASEAEVHQKVFSAVITTVAAIAVIVLGTGLMTFLFSANIKRTLKRVADDLRQSSDQVASAASQVSSTSQALAQGSGEQAASIEETSSSLEELASMTRRNAENAQKANELAKQARNAADKGTTDMRTMNTAMEAIKVSGDDIAKIIKTIDEIAFQTNILALNAAVEAARAGEAGMGFAVVADEVRNLAQRSAQAAKETAAKIEGAISKTAQGVEISGKVAVTLNEIVTKARQVDELASEVASASREQTQGITQINTAVGQMDTVTQSNAASAEESAAAAQELNAQARMMKSSVGELLQLVGGARRALDSELESVKTGGNAGVATTPLLAKATSRGSFNGNGGGPHHATGKPEVAVRRNEIPLEGDFKDF